MEARDKNPEHNNNAPEALTRNVGAEAIAQTEPEVRKMPVFEKAARHRMPDGRVVLHVPGKQHFIEFKKKE